VKTSFETLEENSLAKNLYEEFSKFGWGGIYQLHVKIASMVPKEISLIENLHEVASNPKRKKERGKKTTSVLLYLTLIYV